MLRRDPFANLEPLVKRIYAYVAYRVGDGPDADDITSATFERALRYRKNYDQRRGEPIQWLIGIAQREIVAHFGTPEHPEGDLADAVAPGDVALDVMTRLDLHAAVDGLQARDRELIALRYGADLSARQIAELLDLKTNAVEVALHRSLRRLRDGMTAPTPATPAPKLGLLSRNSAA
jgi:RNA polymerase sigma factor (sigma-70 family)